LTIYPVVLQIQMRVPRATFGTAVASNEMIRRNGPCIAVRGPVELALGSKEIQFSGEVMATATVAPAQETKKAPLNLTPQAIAKVREIMATQDPLPAGLRIGVVGGGCSGFQYSMAFENQSGMMDKVFSFDDLKVFVDATSLMYLNGCIVDYVETLEAAGFKFENPQVKSTCGCGSSFSV
jgi:iron-sulfur cluster assembly accessory protein